jgi:hypothetical protein
VTKVKEPRTKLSGLGAPRGESAYFLGGSLSAIEQFAVD